MVTPKPCGRQQTTLSASIGAIVLCNRVWVLPHARQVLIWLQTMASEQTIAASRMKIVLKGRCMLMHLGVQSVPYAPARAATKSRSQPSTPLGGLCGRGSDPSDPLKGMTLPILLNRAFRPDEAWLASSAASPWNPLADELVVLGARVPGPGIGLGW